MCAKIDRARRNFAQITVGLRCPLCGKTLSQKDASFRCAAGHCFDLSAKNYLNLAPSAGQPDQYGRQLFLTRRRVFKAGFYNQVLAALGKHALAEHARLQRPLTVLDAGCGEGFFARGLLNSLPPGSAEVLALDLSKDGLILAAQAEPALKCLLADLAALPLNDNSTDIILNILSPANYREFRRILRPGGLLLKIIPGVGYLRQVRAAYKLPQAAESEALRLFRELPAEKTEATLCYTLPVNAEQAADFLLMSPLSEHRTPPKADFTEITVDLWLLTARFN